MYSQFKQDDIVSSTPSNLESILLEKQFIDDLDYLYLGSYGGKSAMFKFYGDFDQNVLSLMKYFEHNRPISFSVPSVFAYCIIEHQKSQKHLEIQEFIPNARDLYTYLQEGFERLNVVDFSSYFVSIYNKLQKAFDELYYIHHISHGDIHWNNILISENEMIYLIDWEFAQKHANAQDSLNHKKGECGTEKDSILRLYTSMLGIYIHKTQSFEIVDTILHTMENLIKSQNL